MNVGTLWWDLRVGARSLLRRPGFALAVIALLALGIGGSTAVCGLLRSIFLHPVRVPHQEGVVAVYRTSREANGGYTGFESLSYPDYVDIRDGNRVFSSLALHQSLPMNLSTAGGAERVRGTFATANYFDVLGLKPAHGRFFLPEEDAPGSFHAVAVLSHGAWERLFGGDPGVLERRMLLNGRSFAIVGVAPEGFKGTELSLAADLWVPMRAFQEVSPYGELFDGRGNSLFYSLGRLKDGVGLEQAGADLTAIGNRLAQEHPASAENKGLTLLPVATAALNPRDRGRYLTFGKTLAVTFGLVLLIAGVNVGNLLLIRGLESMRELAIRQSVGADRWRAIRPRLAETVLLFLLGGVASLAVARWALGLLWGLRPPELAEALLDLRLDPSTVGVALLLTLVSGLLFGVVPVVRSLRPDLRSLFRSASPMQGGRRHLRSLLVAGQMALALVALMAASFFLQSLVSAQRMDLGFDPERMAVLTVAPGDQSYDEARGRVFYEQLLERVGGLSGVESVALSENRLLRGAIMRSQVFRPGEDTPILAGGMMGHRVNVVAPGFFRAVGIPLVAGRDFSPADCVECPPAVIVNRTMAETIWPGEDPVGKRFHLTSPNDPLVEVVGVAENAKYREIFEGPIFFVYRPLSQQFAPSMTLHVRTAGAPEEWLPAIAREVKALDSHLPLADVDVMERFVASALWVERTSAFLLTVLGLLALTLAVMGLYAVVAYTVSQRGREIGIRLALGSTPSGVHRLVLREIAGVIGLGLVLGLALSWFVLRPVIAGLLHEVSPADPASYLGQVLLLLGVGFMGAYVSSRRAAAVDPAAALRSE